MHYFSLAYLFSLAYIHLLLGVGAVTSVGGRRFAPDMFGVLHGILVHELVHNLNYWLLVHK